MKVEVGKDINPKDIMIGSAVILGIVAVFVIVMVLIKKFTKVQDVELPKDTDWGRTLTDVEQDQVMRLADALHFDMNGWNIWGHDRSIYQEYSMTTDKVFVATANYFASKYGDGENLAQWLKDEAFAFSALTDSIISRLQKFGIYAQ